MEEEEKGEFFQKPTQFESDRLEKRSSSKSPKKLIVIIFAIIVLALIVFGVFKFISGGSTSETDTSATPTEEVFPTEEPTPTDEVTPTSEATATVTPKASATPTTKPTGTTGSSTDKTTGLDRSKLAIHVLNGTGESGVAKTAGDYLTGLGYNVVQVGNADNNEYTNTTVRIKASEDDFLALLKKDLGGKYTVGSTSTDLDESGRDDAVVIIGK